MIKLISIFAAFMLLSGVFVAVGAIRGCSASQAERGVVEEIEGISPAYTLTAGELYAAYLDDEDGAIEVYGGQVVQISGVVDSLTDESHPPFVSFVGRGAWGVKCFLTDEEYDRVLGLEDLETKRLIMKGRVDKRELHLNMRGCTLEGTEELPAPSASES